MENLTLCLVIILLIAGAAMDLQYFRVPNILTFPAMAAGLFLCGLQHQGAVMERLLWFVIFFMFGMTGIMGMGDLKLCMAVLSIRGLKETGVMMLGATVFMSIYCIFSNRKDAEAGLKESVCAILHGVRPSSVTGYEYPFAFFLAMGYGLNFFAN